jgi:pseudouridine synthase
MPSKNTPRFLDYRNRKLPLDVALSFGIPTIAFDDDGSSKSIAINAPRDLILSGRVLVNKSVERSCHRIVDRFDDEISIIAINDAKNGADQDDRRCMTEERRIIPCISRPVYFLCYKPRGVVCSQRRNEGIDREDSVLISDWLARVFQAAAATSSSDCDAINKKSMSHHTSTSIKTVGRLDEESEGLILLTNDGSFSRLLCDPEFGLRKTYRVVVRGSCYNNLIAVEEQSNNAISSNELAKRKVVEMIIHSNDLPTVTTDIKNGKQTIHHFPFESCEVLDVGQLQSQHSLDDSYYALIDLVLCEGKRHAVRRICKNAKMRVCFLSRISVEGVDEEYYRVNKPNSILEAHMNAFIPGGRHRDIVADVMLVAEEDNSSILLQSGDVVELRDCDVDRIFALRSTK